MQKATKLHANLDMISENPSIDTCDRWGNMIFFFSLQSHFFFSAIMSFTCEMKMWAKYK